MEIKSETFRDQIEKPASGSAGRILVSSASAAFPGLLPRKNGRLAPTPIGAGVPELVVAADPFRDTNPGRSAVFCRDGST
jgi:hypothetical protein